MPILAGRVLATGWVDWVGVLLAVGVSVRIPTHILTFSLRYAAHYEAAGVPTFPSTYNAGFTRTIIAVSSILASLTMGAAAFGIGISWGFFRLLGVLSVGLLLMAVAYPLFLDRDGVLNHQKEGSYILLG